MLGLVTDAFGGRGGIAQAARDVIEAIAFQDQVESVHIMPRQTADNASRLPPKVRQDRPRAGKVIYSLAALQAAVERPDLVFCNHLYMAPLALLTAKVAGARLAIQLHGIEIWSQPTTAQREALEAADLVLCVSRDTRTRALTHADIVPERAVVLNNTVGRQFTPGDRAAARARFGLSDEFALLTVGRLAPEERYKGHDRVISALPQLNLTERGVVYLIAGDGDDRGRLKALADKAGVAERVRFLGQVPAEDLPDLYRAADLFVLASTGEGFGIVFLEAMACGTLALGLAAGGAPDALADGELGACVSEPDFACALTNQFSSRRPDPEQLSADTLARFGRALFQARLAEALRLLN